MNQSEALFKESLEAAIVENENLINKGNLDEAISNLLIFEKKARLANYLECNTMILVKIIDWSYQLQRYDALISNIHMLSKKRGQIKASIKSAIKSCMKYLEFLPYNHKMQLIETLLSVTEGKIFMEKQKARLIMTLAKIYESESRIVEAANILQEVQVETYNSMKKHEKAQYVLEQMRLCLLKEDYVRTLLVSRKLSSKVFDESGYEDLKIKYYTLMITYHSHINDYLEIFKCYRAVYDMEVVQKDEQRAIMNLTYLALYIILAPYSNEQQDLLNHISEDKKLSALPVYQDLIKSFLTIEIISWKALQVILTPNLQQLQIQGPMESILKDLQIRVTEHNIRVVACYYSKIGFMRLSQLLDLSESETEERLSSLVINKIIFARIDRINGIINFVKTQQASQVMNDWASDISQLLNLVDRTCYLIHREYMINVQSES